MVPIAIYSTFDLPLFQLVVDWWLRFLSLPGEVRQTQPHDLFASLLKEVTDPAARAFPRARMILVRLSDWCDLDEKMLPADASSSGLVEARSQKLADCLQLAADSGAYPALVIHCPSAGELAQDSCLRQAFAGQREILKSQLEQRSLDLIASSDLLASYPSAMPLQPIAERLVGVPYTDEFAAAVGTCAVRLLFGCFAGVARGIVVNCARNGDLDDWLQFAQPGRRVRFTHCESAADVWTHLIAISQETHVPLNSWVWIDDNARRLDAIRTHFPRVLAERPDTAVLRHVWTLDPAPARSWPLLWPTPPPPVLAKAARLSAAPASIAAAVRREFAPCI